MYASIYHKCRIQHQNWYNHTTDVRWITHPKFGSEVKTDDITHAPKGHEKVYYSHNEISGEIKVGPQPGPKN